MRAVALVCAGVVAVGLGACARSSGDAQPTPSPTASTSSGSKPPAEIVLSSTLGIALLPDGGLLIADGDAGRVVRADLATGDLEVLPSDGMLAPTGVGVADDGTAYVADRMARAVFKINDGSVALLAEYGEPLDVVVDRDGAVFVTGREQTVVQLDPATGRTTPVAGTGADASTGDGGPAREASLASPHGVAVAADGALVVAELASVRRIDPVTGDIHAVAGSGQRQLCGEQGPALQVCLTALRVDFAPNGDFYVADPENSRLWQVRGGQARALDLGFPPLDVEVESPTTLLVADNQASRIVRYDLPSGVAVTVVE